jgi:cephalosporin-C deacetylase-like acetyl esterase
VRRGFLTLGAALVLAGCGSGGDVDVVRSKADYDKKPVKVEQISQDQLFSDITFPSSGGNEATGSIVLPAHRSGKVPVVLWAHPYGSARSQFAPEAARLAERGIASIMWDSNMTRFNRAGVDLQDPVYASETFEKLMLQDVVDARVLLDYVEKRPELDSSRIGFVGADYGAMLGTILGVADDRIGAFVLTTSFAESSRYFAKQLVPPEGVDSFVKDLSRYDPVNLVGSIDEPMLIQNARRDSLITKEEYDKLDAAADGADVKWYDADHGLVVEAEYDRDAWLADKLGVASTR